MNTHDGPKPERENEPGAAGPRVNPEPRAMERQRMLLKLAIRRDWLHPNPFDGHYEAWKNLSVCEADRLLDSMSPARLEALEREYAGNDAKRQSAHPAAEQIGLAAENLITEIGRNIDGGL